MYDIGILVFDHLIPDQYTELFESIKSINHTLAEHEEENFGITHAELGKRFIERWWPVSPDMVKAIGTHHDETGTDGNVKQIAHLLTTANFLAKQNGFGKGIVPGDAAPLEYSLLDKLDLDFDELETLIENTK
jgi:HD-like signal output (HDOD) protein